MLALMLSLALAQDPEPTEPPPEPVVEPVVEEEEVEVSPAFEVGEVQFFSVKNPMAPALDFNECTVLAPTQPRSARAAMQDGQVRLQLTFRKGKVSLVTVTETTPSLDWVTPCLKREVAAVEWDIKKGRAEVPVTVTLEDEQ